MSGVQANGEACLKVRIEDWWPTAELLQRLNLWSEPSGRECFCTVSPSVRVMLATGVQGSSSELVASVKRADLKTSASHISSATSSSTPRAAASHAAMMMYSRAGLEDVEIVVLCTGRFSRFVYKRLGRRFGVLSQWFHRGNPWTRCRRARHHGSIVCCRGGLRPATAISLPCRPGLAARSGRTCSAWERSKANAFLRGVQHDPPDLPNRGSDLTHSPYLPPVGASRPGRNSLRRGRCAQHRREHHH